MKYVQLSLASLLLIIPLSAQGDTIVLDGELHEHVLVKQTSSMYYVQFPEDGTVRSVIKTKVDAQDVSIDESDAERELLRTKWKANSKALHEVEYTIDKRVSAPKVELTAEGPRNLGAFGISPAPLGATAVGGPSGRPPTPLGGEIVTDGIVPYINLKDVPLGQALKAILRPLNLDYSIEPGYIWVSTAEKIRTEPLQNLQTRYYTPKSVNAETLFKVVVTNPGGQGF